jgi:hypothetical protein
MIKCPFCHFDNEDGALFCEQCKSDLSGVQAEPVYAQPVMAEPVMAEPVFAEPVLAEPVMAEPILAEPVMAEPVMAEAVYAEPQVVAPEPVFPAFGLDPVPAPPIPPSDHLMQPEPVAVAPVPQPPAPPVPAAPEVVPAVPAAPEVVPATSPTPPPTTGERIPAGAQPVLLVQRGQKKNVEYQIYEGLNFIGRADEKPVDIDLEDQEPPDRVWCSRQHACISWEGDQLFIEDLNSANGTYVNRARIYPGQRRSLASNDIVQIGNVQLKVVFK